MHVHTSLSTVKCILNYPIPMNHSALVFSIWGVFGSFVGFSLHSLDYAAGWQPNIFNRIPSFSLMAHHSLKNVWLLRTLSLLRLKEEAVDGRSRHYQLWSLTHHVPSQPRNQCYHWFVVYEKQGNVLPGNSPWQLIIIWCLCHIIFSRLGQQTNICSVPPWWYS